MEGRFPEVRDNVKLVQGLFNESLPKFIKSYYKVRNPVDVTYLHIDCDLYQGMLSLLWRCVPFECMVDGSRVGQLHTCNHQALQGGGLPAMTAACSSGTHDGVVVLQAPLKS